jgi:protein-tyrosine phosphatase
VIDFHSHVLPGIDDGSRSVEESRRMLAASAGQGITHMAATPHFYPTENSPEQFLARRGQAAARLRAVWQPEFPRLLMGAEVCYFDGISRSGGLEALRIEGTSLLLLEMPVQTWSDRMAAEIKALHSRPGFTVLLAHIERYLRLQRGAVWDGLLAAGVLMQSNASFFLRWSTRRRAVHMLEAGRLHLLGSDCHNMADRAPRMGGALAVIGEKRRRLVEGRCRTLLELEEEVR